MSEFLKIKRRRVARALRRFGTVMNVQTIYAVRFAFHSLPGMPGYTSPEEWTPSDEAVK
jgi:hypothetical protein